MRLTSRGEYALLALIYLAKQPPEQYTTVQTIADAQEIPLRFLEQIMLGLKRGRYVTSSKGQRGGYRLTKSAAEISLAEIIRLIDGPLAPTLSVSKYYYVPTPIEREKSIISVFKSIRDYVAKTLETTTLADVS